MADQQQLSLLRQSSKLWNTWRDQHPGILINLSEADLIEANLVGANLSNAILLRAKLTRAKLGHANLSGADLGSAYLMEANLTKATLTGGILSNAHLNGAHLNDASLAKATLIGTDVSRANLTGATLDGVLFSNANLFGADLSYVNLTNANLTGANLVETDLSYANLTGADLSYATVGWTVFGDVDLRSVKGLETVHHLGPSTIGTDTIVRSRGQIPPQFLREAGISGPFIAWAQAQAQSSREYFTHLISFSSADARFARRLLANLQQKGIHCWLSPEYSKIGGKLKRLDEIIRRYDRLLLILSENSLASSWIEEEVDAALTREHHTQRAILFPICLDTALKESTTSWSVALRNTRHISNFVGWKHQPHYERGMQQLLSDLYPEVPLKAK